MIQGITVHPKPQNRNAWYLCFACVGLAAVCLIVAGFLVRYRGVIQLTAVFFLVTAILLYVRYIGAHYAYEITEDYEGVPVFVVTQTTGKRVSTMCRVALWDITDITRQTRAEAQADKPDRKVFRLYRYMPTIRPAVSYRLTVEGAERSIVRIEGTEEFIDYLSRVVAEAKEMKPREDEEEY